MLYNVVIIRLKYCKYRPNEFLVCIMLFSNYFCSKFCVIRIKDLKDSQAHAVAGIFRDFVASLM